MQKHLKKILELKGNCHEFLPHQKQREWCWVCPIKPQCAADNLYWFLHPQDDTGDYTIRVQFAKKYIINNFTEEEIFEFFL